MHIDTPFCYKFKLFVAGTVNYRADMDISASMSLNASARDNAGTDEDIGSSG